MMQHQVEDDSESEQHCGPNENPLPPGLAFRAGWRQLVLRIDRRSRLFGFHPIFLHSVDVTHTSYLEVCEGHAIPSIYFCTVS
jgi:hypothetical protein